MAYRFTGVRFVGIAGLTSIDPQMSPTIGKQRKSSAFCQSAANDPLNGGLARGEERTGWRKAKYVPAAEAVEPFLCEEMLSRRVDIAQATLQGRTPHVRVRSAQRVAAAHNVGAGGMDPGACLKSLDQVSLVVECAFERTMPLLFG